MEGYDHSYFFISTFLNEHFFPYEVFKMILIYNNSHFQWHMKYLSLHQNIVTKVSACRDVGTFDYYILSYYIVCKTNKLGGRVHVD